MHGGQRLRGHGRYCQRLQQTRHNERRRRPGETAERGSHGEAGKTDQEDRLAPKNIAEPAPGDEKHGVDHGVAGNDEPHIRRGGVQTRRDGRHGDNDDEEVEQRQKRTHQQTRKRPPPRRIDSFRLDRHRKRGGSHGGFVLNVADQVLSH
jgi:hypothetical protein